MKNMMITAFALALLVPASQGLADGHEHSKKSIKLLEDSAAALSSSNPDLSSRLKEYSARESRERESSESEQGEKNESQDIRMLREAAEALKTTRPDLSKWLKRYASQEEREERGELRERSAPSGGQERSRGETQPETRPDAAPQQQQGAPGGGY